MMDDRAPDETINVTVDGYNVVAYSFGSGDEVLFCVNGGPGLPCDYVRDAHSWLADKGYRVVAFDQLGTGKSDRPDDASLWTIERYVEETETVRTALGLGPVHYYGQSWGTWLGQEWALAYPESFKTITLANGAGDIPHLVSELHRLRHALGHETEAMMQRHEAEGTIDHPPIRRRSPSSTTATSAVSTRGRPPSCARSATGTWDPTRRSRAPTSSATPAASRTRTGCLSCIAFTSRRWCFAASTTS